MALSVWNLFKLRHGLTHGLEVALRYSLLYTAVAGALTAAAYIAIRNGDRPPWRRVSWLFAALPGVIVASSLAL